MTSKKKKLTVLFSLTAAFLVALVIHTVWADTALVLSEYTVSGETLPKSFDGLRIAHVSDLHNTEIGEDNKRLLDMLCDAKPDIIAITGDLIDSRETDVAIALEFAKGAMDLAPCYYVNGNHESRVEEYTLLKEGLVEAGVIILENDKIEIERSGERIVILGVNDPVFDKRSFEDGSASVMESQIEPLTEDGVYNVLLSHRPELFEVYADSGVDLVLSGHAHGGQFRLPIVGGLVAPQQGFFPEYDAGLFVQGNTNMIISRGIGNSIIPIRFNNRPEVVLITLKSE